LISASGEIVLKGTDEIGFSSDLTARQINDYLNTPTGESLTVWGYGLWAHTLITLAGLTITHMLFLGGEGAR